MSRTLIKTLVRAYHSLSPATQSWLGLVLYPVRMTARGFSCLCFEVYRVGSDEQPCYYLTSSCVDPYFIAQFCPEEEITRTGELYAWRVREFVRTHPAVILDMHTCLAPFFQDGLLTVPWVRQVLDLQVPMEDILPHIRERKKISAFQAEISTRITDLRDFYEKVYIPYTLTRYPDAKIIDFASFNEHRLYQDGELLTIKKDGIPVGGACAVLAGSTWYWRINGLVDDRFLREGAMAAIYYFSILRAKERKARTMEFGSSRPFITDGVLSFKRKWRATIPPALGNRVVYLKNLKKEGLIVWDEGSFKVLVFSEETAADPRYADCGLAVKREGPGSSGNG